MLKTDLYTNFTRSVALLNQRILYYCEKEIAATAGTYLSIELWQIQKIFASDFHLNVPIKHKSKLKPNHFFILTHITPF